MNELGFNCVRFNLKFNMTMDPNKLSLIGDFKLGLRRIWADQLQDILNAVQGPKILYTFSMPGSSAIEAISKRHAYQIKGMVCDSGPFLNIVSSTWKLYEHTYRIENKWLRALYTAISFSMWGVHFKNEMKRYFENFPPGFKILSIRGGSDQLVPPETVNAFFDLGKNCNIETLMLPGAGHLEGLKKFSAVYVPRVKSFLESLV